MTRVVLHRCRPLFFAIHRGEQGLSNHARIVPVALAELELGVDNIESSEFDIDDKNQAIETELAALKERRNA